ncbi:hypothetical protein [Lentilactobacillus kisonensis]|uniref:Uncharacterized protein n=2 Tax=Lentilactobacillus kisonensis TaxID=481722 RepID=H1LC13_9LACO|nr:hypothetical protein [Lentilactobacillus kisonensis]EHO54485.1 hypothetical protein HMPREF9104_00125 [Lentilactobacillus kisonensis F0435]KRL21178.1 hypothetical protein FC98_GL000875 [Lentilactobacillus kisonensis DSM 19906 = JCM 15041]
MSRIIQLNLSELDHTRSSRIIDEYKDTKYLIVGKWGLISDAFSVYSVSGDILAKVRQQSMGINPKFDVFFLRQFVGSSVINVSMHYTTIFINGIDWLIIGNQEKQSYVIWHKREKIATIKSYGQSDQIIRLIKVDNIKHEPLVVAIAAILNHPSLVHTARLKLRELGKLTPKPDPNWENSRLLHFHCRNIFNSKAK